MGRREEIVSAARSILEADGPDGLTMRAIAEKLGIRAPSLYKHISDKSELEVAIVADGLAEQAEVFEKAVRENGDPVTNIAGAYRSFAIAHPHLYRLMTDRPLQRTQLPDGTEARAAAPLVDAVGGDTDRARATWAFAHGMVSLEIADRFPPDADLDAAWAAGLSGLRS